MVKNAVVCTYYKKKILCLYINDGVVQDMNMYDDCEVHLKSVYIGKVKNIVKNIQAAFVEVAPGVVCFLKLENLDKINVLNRNRDKADLKQGDEILVQISKGAVKDKAPVCTGRIKLPADILRDVLTKAPMRTCYSVLYGQQSPFLAFFDKISGEKISKITCVDDDLYQEVDAYLAGKGDEKLRAKLNQYSDPDYPLNKLYKIDSLIAELTGRVVWLKSGANIVIDYTEAMTVIDVNSAKSIIDRHDDHIYRVNAEAALEAFRQIRLRNLSGMILIDFINDDKEGTDRLIEYVKELAASDPAGCHYVDLTGLGIAEFTRTKQGHPIYELL